MSNLKVKLKINSIQMHELNRFRKSVNFYLQNLMREKTTLDILSDFDKNDYEKHYSLITIPKKNGKKRIVQAPSPILKVKQKSILMLFNFIDEFEKQLIDILGEKQFLDIYNEYLNTYYTDWNHLRAALSLSGKTNIYKYKIVDCAHGYKKGKSIITNASIHKNSKYFFKTDIKEAFPSIKENDICKIIHRKINIKYKFLSEIYWTIHNMYEEDKLKEYDFSKCIKTYRIQYYLSNLFVANASKLLCFRGVLATGSPVSPYILNEYLYNFDTLVSSYCKSRDLLYSRYADDIIISSKKKIPVKTPHYIQNLLDDFGMKLNTSKTKKQTYKQKNVITGVVVTYNQDTHKGNLGIGYKKFNHLKKQLYKLQKDELSLKEKQQALGMLSYLKSVNQERYTYLINKYKIEV